MRRLLFTAILLGAAVLTGWAQTTTIILVRHAEKGFDEGGDPELTEAGHERARELARILEPMPIAAIYSTPFKRTEQTVVPLAEAKELAVNSYNPFKMDEVLEVIKENSGKYLVFSGHSNTTPVLVNKLLGEDRYSQLDEKDYDNLYIVTLQSDGTASVAVLEYGANTEP